ncbi:MAG: amino acid-binding protein [Deltaproteobacteria bacterium]|nr:amino acid-binding protein [Deltaproteobacteria bacterium]
MKLLKQLSVHIENVPGRLYEVTKWLGNAGINLRALNLVDKGDFGLLRLLVTDIVKTRRVMMENQLPAFVENVVAIEVEDKPGKLAELLKSLYEANIGVVYMYAFTGLPNKAVMIFHFSDNEGALQVLEESGIMVFDSESFGIIDSYQ